MGNTNNQSSDSMRLLMHVPSFSYLVWFDVFAAGATSEVAAGAPSIQPVAGSSASEVSAAVPENESPATIPTADVSAAMATNEVLTFSGIPVTSEYVQVTEIELPPMIGKILKPDFIVFFMLRNNDWHKRKSTNSCFMN